MGQSSMLPLGLSASVRVSEHVSAVYTRENQAAVVD